MSQAWVLLARAAAGGTLVVVFALVSEVTTPKAFSGLFSGAPSVALASLTITLGLGESRSADAQVAGMIVGAVALVASCVVATMAIPRVRAGWGSAAAWCAWGATAAVLYWGVYVGAR